MANYPLSGVNFVNQQLTPSSDGALYKGLLTDGILHGCALSAVGTTLKIAPGYLVIGGQQMQVDSECNITITDQSSGFARILAVADLSKTATESVFEQAWLKVEYASSVSGFQPLVQEDLQGSGTYYEAVICVVALGSGGITGIRYRAYSHGRGRAFQLTLAAANWSNDQVTVAADVLASDEVIACYAPSYHDDWMDADIYLSGQADGSLTFSCVTAPSSDITVNILLL